MPPSNIEAHCNSRLDCLYNHMTDIKINSLLTELIMLSVDKCSDSWVIILIKAVVGAKCARKAVVAAS